MSGKRPPPPGGEQGEIKRFRSSDGSPAPAPANSTLDDDKKKQDVKARMEALKAKLAASKPNGTPQPATATPPLDAEAARRAEGQRIVNEAKARIAAKQQPVTASSANGARSPINGTPSPLNGASAAGPRPTKTNSEWQQRLADTRARVAELASKHFDGAAPSLPTPPRQDGRTARGGLGVGLHPSLLAEAGASAAKPPPGQVGSRLTTKKNQPSEKAQVNPYLATPEREVKDEQDATYDPAIGARKAGERKSKQLVFNQKGKFLAQANALRQQAALENMKRTLAARARKTQIEEASDKAYLVPVPPAVEWWDEALLPVGQDTYEDWESEGRNRIETDDSIVTALIQRPVLLQAPQDKFIPAAKPLMLTPLEQKKMRRQRRMADMKEEQAKIRLGLVDPPPPKVKKSNMMRVLGEQAVKDPTAVEAQVSRAIAERAADHEQANLSRMLTKEQRAEKLKAQQAGDEARGVKVAVFRVDNFSSGKHRYQVDINAKQQGLTGVVVLNPVMNLVIVEGGDHSIKAYKKLMLRRIKWTENTAPLDDANPSTFTGTTDGSKDSTVTGNQGVGSKSADWCNPLDKDGELKDLSQNKCFLVWEGDEPSRSFKRWGSRACETDGEARDILSRQKMENMWTLARSKS